MGLRPRFFPVPDFSLVKPIVSKDYGSAEEDFDLELEYLLGGVSG